MSDATPLALLRKNDEQLLARLKQAGFSDDRSQGVVHALIDVGECMEKIYQLLLPALISNLNSGDDDFKDQLWDIREEFRHIEYHMKDSGLADL